MIDYKSAGVDIAKGEEAIERIKKHVQSTFTPAVLRGIGSFAGAIDISSIKEMKHPVLLSTIDGVGTKTVVAHALNRFNEIGTDIVHHCANDLVCQGARPLVFLDYIASSKLSSDTLETVVQSAAQACSALECVLIGGETAEMPQVYCEGAHDIVGTMVGIVDHDKMITGEKIQEGDVCIGLPSNGLHTNGYSLARKALNNFIQHGDALLAPHTCYAPLVLKLHEEIGLKGVAHITGGGIAGNIKRIIPAGLRAEIDHSALAVPEIFTIIQTEGSVSESAMDEAFNMGVGMILVVTREHQDAVCAQANGSAVIGTIVSE